MVLRKVVPRHAVGFGVYLLAYLALLFSVIYYWSALIAQITPLLVYPLDLLVTQTERLLELVIVFILTWFFVYFTEHVIREHLDETKNKKEIRLLVQVYSGVVWVLAGIVSLSTIFHGLSVVLASLGLIGAALTLALQRPIMNFVGWLVIIVNKPFTMGDFIRVGNDEGEVIDLTLMYTTLRTSSSENDRVWGKTIGVPNELILSQNVTNLTTTDQWISDEVRIGVTFESDWKKALSDLQEISETVVADNVFDLRPSSTAPSEEQGFLLNLMRNLIDPHKKGRNSKKDDVPSFESLRKTDTRIKIEDSWILIKVRYLTRYQDLLFMRSEIEQRFLDKAMHNKDYSIAYPHVEYVPHDEKK
jgi:small-conductance mechanosensitive channel